MSQLHFKRKLVQIGNKMLKRHVIYVLAALIVAALLAVICINLGTMRTFTKLLMQDGRSNEPDLSKTSEPEAVKCRYDINDYNSIIGSIKRVLEFLRLYVTEMTLDAAVGTRALQGQLQLILESFTLPAKVETQMQEMLKNVTDISEVIVEHFVDTMTKNDQSPAGMERLKQNLYWIESGSLWEMPAMGDWQKSEALDLLRYDVEDDSSRTFGDTSFSDRCIGSVFDNCAVPAECFTLFLEKRYGEYLIAHAILFLLFAKKKNCFNDQQYMEKISKLGHPDDIMASFCAKMFVEAQTNDIRGFDVMYRDLFCEQVLVCSMSGFRQFLHPSWLRTVLSWQSDGLLGCFEIPPHEGSSTFEEIYGIKKESKRVKRYDNVIAAGTQSCSTHFTGVAIGSIGMHLRYMMETCLPTLFEADSTYNNA